MSWEKMNEEGGVWFSFHCLPPMQNERGRGRGKLHRGEGGSPLSEGVSRDVPVQALMRLDPVDLEQGEPAKQREDQMK